MKSIQNQYRDLKEGKMSEVNFMRNLRMAMPQYITNVTSFGDAIKILKNKSILTESIFNEAKPEEKPVVKSGASVELDGMFRDLYGKPFLGGYFLDYAKNPHELVIHISKEPAQAGQKTLDIEKLGTAVCIDGKWSFDGVRAEGNDQETLNKIAASAFPAQNEANEPEDEMSDDEIDALLKGIEDEEYGERVVKSDVLDKPLEEQLNEGKGKELHPNQIHPGELRMGIRVEMEHTDDPKKAEKIALDHLAENPFYYTALKLAGVESPSAPKVKQPEEKKAKKAKETIQLVDLVNGMKKVKMPKAEEKKKLKEQVEEAMRFQDLPADPEVYKTVKDMKGKIMKATNAEGVEFQRGDVVKAYDGEEIKIAEFKEEQGKIKALYNTGMFFKSIDIDGLEAPKQTMRPGVNIGASFEKMKRSLEEIVREVMAETIDGRDNLIDPIASEEENK